MCRYVWVKTMPKSYAQKAGCLYSILHSVHREVRCYSHSHQAPLGQPSTARGAYWSSLPFTTASCGAKKQGVLQKFPLCTCSVVSCSTTSPSGHCLLLGHIPLPVTSISITCPSPSASENWDNKLTGTSHS